MSHSKQTANYGLPLFEPKDRPAWLTDFNGAMTAVDATVKGLEDSIQAGGLPVTGGTMQGSINMGDHAITNVQEVELQGSGDGLYIGSVVQPNGTAGARLTGVAGGGAAFVKSDSQSIYVPVSVGTPSQDKHAATKEYVDTAIGNIPSSGITQEQADARYLQLSGGTMTGDLKVQESPASDASAVSKSYAQGLFASAVNVANTAKSTADTAKSTADAALPKSGGTMTGSLILNGAPTADNQAATKAYVDSKAGGSVTLVENYNVSLTASGLQTVPITIPPITPKAYKSIELTLGLQGNTTYSFHLGDGSALYSPCYVAEFKRASAYSLRFTVPINKATLSTSKLQYASIVFNSNSAVSTVLTLLPDTNQLNITFNCTGAYNMPLTISAYLI